jgi:hypothetical protein
MASDWLLQSSVSNEKLLFFLRIFGGLYPE